MGRKQHRRVLHTVAAISAVIAVFHVTAISVSILIFSHADGSEAGEGLLLRCLGYMRRIIQVCVRGCSVAWDDDNREMSLFLSSELGPVVLYVFMSFFF